MDSIVNLATKYWTIDPDGKKESNLCGLGTFCLEPEKDITKPPHLFTDFQIENLEGIHLP